MARRDWIPAREISFKSDGMKEVVLHTIIDLLERSSRKFPQHAYLWEKCNGKYRSVTYAETREQVRSVAAGLMASGLEKGERVALLSEGCNSWVYAELGILYAGGVNVPLSVKLTEAELVFRIVHAEARFLIVSDHYVGIIRKIEEKLPAVEKIFVVRHSASEIGRLHSFERLKEEGRFWLDGHPGELELRMASVTEGDLANISYTSGTTAAPKGIMLTHGNYVCNVLQADSLIRIPEYYRVLLLLPWDHSFAHTVGIYSFMYNGASVASVDFGRSPMEYLRNIPQNLKEIRPHVLLSVPALARNFRRNIEAAIRAKGRGVQGLYRMGLKLGYRYYRFGSERKFRMSCLLWPLVWGIDRMVFAPVRQVFGGNLRFFIGGGALLDAELQRYYRILGIPMYQGYGLSEASPVISANRPGCYRFGSSGQIVQPMELRICDEDGKERPQGEVGEIVVRGGNVMKGYWKNEQATREAIRDGWLYTGDMGYRARDGWLYVTGRFKSLLISGDGEKYSPEGIEEAMAELSPYIDSCVLYNNQSPYTVGLVVPNVAALRRHAERQGLDPLSIEACKWMLAKVYGEVMKFRKGGAYAGMFPERWLPAVIAVLPETLGVQNGTVNSTAKVVRRRVYEYFREELEFSYTPEGKDIKNLRNTRNLRGLL